MADTPRMYFFVQADHIEIANNLKMKSDFPCCPFSIFLWLSTMHRETACELHTYAALWKFLVSMLK